MIPAGEGAVDVGKKGLMLLVDSNEPYKKIYSLSQKVNYFRIQNLFKKYVTLLYTESKSACKNQLLSNMCNK